jgi:transposase-like protein
MAGLTVLTEQHKRVAEALLRGIHRTKIATDEGVNRTTLYRWLREPLFLAYYEALADEIESARTQRLIPVAMAAAEAVETALDNAVRALKSPNPVERAEAPGLETLSRALKTVIELERVDRGKPSTVTESRLKKDDERPLGKKAKELVDSLTKWTEAENAAGVPESPVAPEDPKEVN